MSNTCKNNLDGLDFGVSVVTQPIPTQGEYERRLIKEYGSNK